MTQQPSILERAKQGDPQAIAALMNRSLQPKGITAKASLKDGCLRVMLESEQVPDQKSSVAFVQNGMSNLAIASIDTIKVFGRQAGEEMPAWSQEIALAKAEPIHVEPAPVAQPQEVEPKPVSEAPSKRSPSNAESILGLVLLVFVFGGCVYNVGKPWNCEQARQAVQEAQKSYDDNYNKQLSKVYVDKETITSMYAEQSRLTEAQNKAAEKCN